jgi:CRP-like cAMP-binding protein
LRLWDEVRPHAIEPGTVGDYVALQIRAGPAEAARAFPDVAAHGVDECPSCSEVALDVRAFLMATVAPARPSAETEEVHQHVASGTKQSAGTEATEALMRVPLFAGMSEEGRKHLSSVLRARRYARGEAIFLGGDEGTALCLIAEGRIRVQLTGADGREIVVNVFGPGEIFGEMALLDGEPQSATAIAQEPSRVYWLQRDDFQAFLDAHPRAATTMLASLSRRLRHTTRVVQGATFREVPARLARALLDLAAEHGRPADDGIRIAARVTQTDLASKVGASRETIIRALHGFERRGWIRWQASGITIKQPDQLRTRADDA